MTDRRNQAPHTEPTPEDNPFAPPPEDGPDRPWQPRRSPDSGASSDSSDDQGTGGEPSDDGRDGQGQDGSENGSSRWGSKWSSRQPSRGSGGFGATNGSGQEPGSGDQGKGGLRWDPSDKRQRHARYALHAGIWGLFFALFSLSEIALLLGALSVYWGINGLRDPSRVRNGSRRTSKGSASAEDIAGTDRPNQSASSGSKPPVVGSPAQQAKARTTAATSGLIAGAIALAVVAGGFTMKLVYSDYYSCKQDSLTQAAGEHCDDLVPDRIQPLLEEG